MATATARAARAPAKDKQAAPKAKGHTDEAVQSRNDGVEVEVIVRELAAVADYIGHMKKEIAALRANELSRERIPSANDELGNVVQATASATHTIMEAAEEILGSGGLSDKDYRELVETRVLAIFEACSFQDITGQRINKVLELLGQLEKRLDRFAKAVNVRDSADGVDPEDVLRQARREVLLLHGPQNEDVAIKQDDIDALFD
jgi:chemotaxis protein CheZ